MEKPFEVHVYKMNGECSKHQLYNKLNAFYLATDKFKGAEVYKVKVWDLRAGEPDPNNDLAIGLLLHLV